MSRSEFFQRAARLYLEKVPLRTIVTNLDQVHPVKDSGAETSFREAALSHLRDVTGEDRW